MHTSSLKQLSAQRAVICKPQSKSCAGCLRARSALCCRYARELSSASFASLLGGSFAGHPTSTSLARLCASSSISSPASKPVISSPMAHNPRQALAAPLTITWLTEPDQIDDDENSTLTVELPKRSRLVKCISEAKEIDLPVSSTPDHCLLDYRWVALIVASVALLDFESLIGSCHIFNGTFELGWTLALLIVLEKELLFDDPVFSLARLLQRLRRWRELKLSDNSLPDECILRESGWSSDSLMVGTWCFDDDYIPWVTDVTFSTDEIGRAHV